VFSSSKDLRLTFHPSAKTTNKLEKVKNGIFLAKSNESHLKKIGKEKAEENDEATKDVDKYREKFKKTYKNVLTGMKSALSHSCFCRYITVCLVSGLWAILLDTADSALLLVRRTGNLVLDVVEKVVDKQNYFSRSDAEFNPQILGPGFLLEPLPMISRTATSPFKTVLQRDCTLLVQHSRKIAKPTLACNGAY
jgi:hypothetical protein